MNSSSIIEPILFLFVAMLVVGIVLIAVMISLVARSAQKQRDPAISPQYDPSGNLIINSPLVDGSSGISAPPHAGSHLHSHHPGADTGGHNGPHGGFDSGGGGHHGGFDGGGGHH
jgi:uncharacterized membrane protein YgcG